ncbi:MAG: NHL repeat-containing protein [Armatimonadota bacterium]
MNERFEFLELGDGVRRAPAPAPEAPVAPARRKLVIDQTIGSFGSAVGRFNSPAGLAVDAQGNLYVADSYNHRVQKITPVGDVTAFGGKGSGSGKFLNPQDVAVDRELSVYVLEQGNCRIQKFTRDGYLERTIGGRGSRPGKLSSPMGIAVDRYGCIYVADTGNGRLQKLSAVGNPLWIAPSRGPQGVDVDNACNCWVADTFSDCVVKFDPAGREVERFGSQGSCEGEFDEPQDIAIGGFIYVIEMANNRLQAFESKKSVACLSGQRDIGKLSGPTGIAIGLSGEIYISDTKNHRILRAVWRT